MTAFDPAEAEQEYARLETEELIRISYLEPTYLPEAKALAARELDKRGIQKNRQALIKRVRAELRDRKLAPQRLADYNHRKLNDFKLKISSGILLVALWFFALLGPAVGMGWESLPEGPGILLLIVWLVSVFLAVRDARRGQRRQLYLILVIPGVLFALGLIIRLLG